MKKGDELFVWLCDDIAEKIEDARRSPQSARPEYLAYLAACAEWKRADTEWLMRHCRVRFAPGEHPERTVAGPRCGKKPKKRSKGARALVVKGRK